MAMVKIDLQNKTKPREGSIECYRFENENIGLSKTMFHRITIPLEPFDSGLTHVDQPEETAIVIEWINLGLRNPSDLDGVEISSKTDRDLEASIYVGTAHNWIEVDSLTLKATGSNRYELHGKVKVRFEDARIGANEGFHFTTTAVYEGQI
jgi:hypothetical protein